LETTRLPSLMLHTGTSSSLPRLATAGFSNTSKVFVCPSLHEDAAKITALAISCFSSYGLSDNSVHILCPDDCNGSDETPYTFGVAGALPETKYRTDNLMPGDSFTTLPITGGNKGFISARHDRADSSTFRPVCGPAGLLLAISGNSIANIV
jgi:hypothetical protein